MDVSRDCSAVRSVLNYIIFEQFHYPHMAKTEEHLCVHNCCMSSQGWTFTDAIAVFLFVKQELQGLLQLRYFAVTGSFKGEHFSGGTFVLYPLINNFCVIHSGAPFY